MNDFIEILGARENNLKNIDLLIPRNKLIIFTGLSGSGKSTLAFDTIFAEGQRRYMQSLSSYARQFLGQFEKPDIDFALGLSPTVSIDQKSTNNNPRSTVGTITEIYDYLRLLFARIGDEFCLICNEKITAGSAQNIVKSIKKLDNNTKIRLISPIVSDRKGEYAISLSNLKKNGFSRVIIDGYDYDLNDDIVLKKNVRHDISVIIDRIVIKDGIDSRLTESVELALKTGGGKLILHTLDDNRYQKFSQYRSCPNDHELALESLEPRYFSFNAPFGACEMCHGIGYKTSFDPSLLISNTNLSLEDGAIEIAKSAFYQSFYKAMSKKINFDLKTPYKKLPNDVKNAILYGKDITLDIEFKNNIGQIRRYKIKCEGIIPMFERRYSESISSDAKARYEQFMRKIPCIKCNGSRLKKEILNVKIDGKSIYDITEMPVSKTKEWIDDLELSPIKEKIAHEILKEIISRLQFMLDVGLHYLTLSRSASTLSGGESQRIRLATQIGAGLVGVTYVLDEPSIGLHQRDNDRLISSLKGLRDLGNTVIVVEHDADTMKASDHIVDIGPLAGESGGKIVHNGTYEEILKNKNSLTGMYLSGQKIIETPKTRRKISKDNYIKIIGAKENNLKNINVSFPLNVFTCVTGVSGSGKSSLVNSILSKTLEARLNKKMVASGSFDDFLGIEKVEKIVHVDQKPIGRTPRSNPATYVGVWDKIRQLYACLPRSKELGFSPGRFSFNVAGGRCETCQGDGVKRIEMNFLPDVFVQCESCGGSRYNKQTLTIKLKDKSIADILDMTIENAYNFFNKYPSIKKQISTLMDVGLGYIKLGQSATTLSGGEAQRVKLSLELQKRFSKKTIYVLDEPTTGLHFDDVSKLLKVLQSLVDKGNTVIVIEHNLDVIKSSDYIIDLGPDGGYQGGELVACGTPEQISKNKNSHTGKYLKLIL